MSTSTTCAGSSRIRAITYSARPRRTRCFRDSLTAERACSGISELVPATLTGRLRPPGFFWEPSALLELDAGLPDHLFPARQVFADLRRKLLRSVAHRLDAEHAVALLHDRVGENRGDFALQALDRGWRRPGRRKHADPGIYDEPREAALREGRNIGQRRR